MQRIRERKLAQFIPWGPAAFRCGGEGREGGGGVRRKAREGKGMYVYLCEEEMVAWQDVGGRRYIGMWRLETGEQEREGGGKNMCRLCKSMRS